MPQLLSIFDSIKAIFGVVEKLNPKAHWGPWGEDSFG
jgi:hypothetical protein